MLTVRMEGASLSKDDHSLRYIGMSNGKSLEVQTRWYIKTAL